MKLSACCIAILLAMLTVGDMRTQQHDPGRHIAQVHSAGVNANNEWSELKASMDKMHAAMGSIKPSGNIDADFVRMMLPHHQAAIDMAKTELIYGKDPQMRRLAQEIITDQQSESDLMQLWLKQNVAEK
jgi:uncharacterized protein (DUF305 family)